MIMLEWFGFFGINVTFGIVLIFWFRRDHLRSWNWIRCNHGL